MKRIFAATLLMTTCSLTLLAQTASRDDLLKDIEAKRAELAKLQEKFLAPSAEDRAAYAEFLSQPDTGLIRLLPREKYDGSGERKAKLDINGGGAYYSFARLTHEYGMGQDIGLESGYLSTGFGGADYGMLTKLEGARLEDVSAELPGLIFLAKYNAVNNVPDARVEQTRFQGGAVIDGISYKRRVPVEVGATYALRSIQFARADVLVAFRVVRQDTDGSLIIAWKLLQKYPMPKLARNQLNN